MLQGTGFFYVTCHIINTSYITSNVSNVTTDWILSYIMYNFVCNTEPLLHALYFSSNVTCYEFSKYLYIAFGHI